MWQNVKIRHCRQEVQVVIMLSHAVKSHYALNIMSPFWREMSLCANGRMTHFVSLLPYFVPTAFGQSLTRTNSLSGRIRDCQVKNRAFMPLFLQRAPLWIVTPVPLFWLPVCWLTQAIILKSGLPPTSLQLLPPLILPREASPLVTLPSRSLF